MALQDLLLDSELHGMSFNNGFNCIQPVSEYVGEAT